MGVVVPIGMVRGLRYYIVVELVFVWVLVLCLFCSIVCLVWLLVVLLVVGFCYVIML